MSEKKCIFKSIPLLVFIFLIFASVIGCAIREDLGSRVLMVNGYAHEFIDDRFEAYVKSIDVSDYFITETAYGSNGFEKAYRFISADGKEGTWGCRIQLQSFKTSGVRRNRNMDFSVMDEGEEYGIYLLEKTLSKAEAEAPVINYSAGENVTVTFPAGWNWWHVGEYFRDYKDETSLKSDDMREYLKNSIEVLFNKVPDDKEKIDIITVQDDLSVSIELNKSFQETRLESSILGWNNALINYDNSHGDGVQRIEYSDDYRGCRVYVDREYIENKLKKNLSHSYSRMDLAILLYRIQVWQGVSPEDLLAEISVIDPETDELICREVISGGIWLDE